MKEAELYALQSTGKVKCTACARYCTLADGQTGLCGIRQNLGGKLFLLSYGKLFTGHIDPIEKKPVSHYHPGTKIFSVATSGCNWLCHPAETRILMSDGTENSIDSLIPGDSVWSYNVESKMEIRANVVTHVGTRTARIWKLRYGTNSQNKLFLTEEHPVLTSNGWKPASELRAGDKVVKVWYQNTQMWKQSRPTSIATASFPCRKFDPEVARRAIGKSKANFLLDPMHGWHRNAERLRTWLHRHPSESQRMLYEVLDSQSLRYEKEYRIKPEKRLTESKAGYFLDAAFPDTKLDVEVDGWWHFWDIGVREQDKVRDETLRINGWRVLRIAGSELYAHPEEVRNLILQAVVPVPMRNKREWLEVTSVEPTDRIEKVFGLETIPDHNYVADQVVVHNCKYCQNYDISQRRKIEGFDIEPAEVPRLALAQDCQGIAYTYNEPTIFIEFARDIGIEGHKKGLFNIFVSNGFDTPDGVKVMDEFLDCITVDFKGSGETNFVRKFIGIPGAEPIFETLLALKKSRIHVEITDLIVPQVGDSLESAKRLSRWVYENLGPEMPVHFLRFHPDYKMMDFPSTPVKTLEAHHKVAKEEGLKYVYLGNVPGHPLEHTYCPECHNIVVKRYSFDITGWFLDDKNNCKFCGAHISIEGGLASTVNDVRFLPAYF